jgi:hypothetical protein
MHFLHCYRYLHMMGGHNSERSGRLVLAHRAADTAVRKRPITRNPRPYKARRNLLKAQVRSAAFWKREIEFSISCEGSKFAPGASNPSLAELPAAASLR